MTWIDDMDKGTQSQMILSKDDSVDSGADIKNAPVCGAVLNGLRTYFFPKKAIVLILPW